MRIRSALFTCTLLAVASSATVSSASAAVSQEDVLARVHSAGYALVSKAEAGTSGIWDVWASKDGIPYEVKVDAKDGTVIQAMPAGAND